MNCSPGTPHGRAPETAEGMAGVEFVGLLGF